MIEFQCPSCGKTLRVHDASAGEFGSCAQCRNVVQVPTPATSPTTVPATAPAAPTATYPAASPAAPAATAPATPAVHTSPATGFGQGSPPHPHHPPTAAPPIAPEQPDGVITTLIPYRNTAALFAYYLGVFSLIPLLGIPLAIAAIVLGCYGLNNASNRPGIKGKAHAWAGILLGLLSTLGYGVIFLIVKSRF